MLAALEEAIDAFTASGDPSVLAGAFVLFDRFRAALVHAVGEFDAAGWWDADGATSMTAWLRWQARLAPGTASSFAMQARRLRSLPVLAAAALDGSLSADQVRVVLTNVSPRTEHLFADVEADLVPLLASLSVADTVAVMKEWSRHADAVVDGPEPREPRHEAHLVRDLDQSWHLDAHLTPDAGALVSKALALAITDDVEAEPVRTFAHRQADALVDVCRWYLEHRDHPPGSRHRPHLDLVQPVDGFAKSADGTIVDPAIAASVACDAALHRLVTNGRSHVLDYGTATRTVPPALFRVLVLRDRHCRFPGCDRTPDWCEAHHVTPYGPHGPTRQDNLVLLCSRHHHRCHQPGWTTTVDPDATLTVTTPTGRTYTSTPRPLYDQLPLPMPACA